MTKKKHLEPTDELSIGETARRSAVSVSTLHFYERMGLVTAVRSRGNQRRYRRAALRRIAIIRIAQQAGLSLADIREALESLPHDRMPVAADWQRLSLLWREVIERRVQDLLVLRDQFDTCIGCGCLSLKDCPLRNPDDIQGRHLKAG